MTKLGLYVLTFNSPNQFQTLINSMLQYDENLIKLTKKYVLDNSTDLLTTPIYENICKKYDFEHIKKENLGICGGRQFIAEHFDNTDLDYMLFFEDDMFLYRKDGAICKNGFNRYVPNFLNKILSISQENQFDFLKLSFTEFFGNNATQWAWYNIPQEIREKYFPEKPKLDEYFNPDGAPKTNFKNIKSYQDIPYVTGDIYYCNWPLLVSKEGNKKMFIDTKWARPYEQTWMSHIFQETKKNKINAGLLLMTPIEHDRFEHYDGNIRKEN